MKKNALVFVSVITVSSMLFACSPFHLPNDGNMQQLSEEEMAALDAERANNENANSNDADNDASSDETVGEITKEEVEGMMDSSKKQLGWDGEYVGAGVSVIISGSESGNPEVKFVDLEMHSSLDEAHIEGNTLIGTYHITQEMYASEGDNAENLPEQTWTLTMVKDEGTIYYSRSAELVWYNLNDDGTYGHTIYKNNTAVLKKVIVNEN